MPCSSAGQCFHLLSAVGQERLTVALVSQVMRTQAPQPDCGRPATTGLSLAVAPIAPFGLSDPYPQLPSVVAPRCARPQAVVSIEA